MFTYGVSVTLKDRGRGNIDRTVWEARLRNDNWPCGGFDNSSFDDKLYTVMDTKNFEEDVISYTAVIITGHSKAPRINRTLQDLSSEEWTRVVEAELKIQWRIYQRQMDVNVIVIGKTASSSSAKRPVTHIESPNPSPSHRRTRTTQQVDAMAEQRDRNEAVGNNDLQLANQWLCKESRCINEGSLCYVDLMTGLHYALKPPAMKKWATAWHYKQEGATLTTPPLALVQELKKQGSVGQNYKDPLAHQRREEKKSSFQELIETYKQTAEISLMKDLGNTIGSSARSQQQQHVQQPSIPYGVSSPFPYSAYGPQYGPPQHHTYYQPPQLPPQHQQYQSTVSPSRDTPPHQPHPPTPPVPSSSPIAPEDEEEQFMNDYWDWKIRSTNSEQKKQVFMRAKMLVEDRVWTKEQLKAMHITSSDEYKRAVEVGLPDGLAAGFKKDFVRFKKNHREEYQTARQLAGLGQGAIS